MSATYNDARGASAGSVDMLSSSRPRVSWSAIFAGVVLVIAIEVVLSVLGTGIGLGFVKPNVGTTPDASGLGTGAGLWWLATTIIALVIGGYAAARLAGVPSRFDGVLHGLVIWGLALLLTMYLLTSAVGGIIGGAFSAVSGTLSAAGSVVGSTAAAGGSGVKSVLPQIEQATGVNTNMVQQQAESSFQPPATQDPASMSRPDAVKAVAQALPDLMGKDDKSAAAKQRITDIVAAQAHISPQDAQKRVDDAQSRLNGLKDQTMQTAKQAADSSASTASNASFLAFAGLIVGAIAAAVGGSMASPRRVELGAGRFR